MDIKTLLKKNKILFFIVKFVKIRVLKTNSEIDVILLKKLKFDTAIDIGSNYGSYTSVLRKISKSVISVEPNTLILNFQKKILGNKNIVFKNVAIGDKNKKVTLNIPFKNKTPIYEEAFISDSIKTKKHFYVNQRNGDELFLDLDNLDFIKIDVEGYENIVIRSLSRSIGKFLPLILIEVETRHSSKQKINKLFNDLKSLDYQFYYMKNGQNLSKIENIDFEWIYNAQKDLNFKKDSKKSIYSPKSTKFYINNFWCFNKKNDFKYEETISHFRI